MSLKKKTKQVFDGGRNAQLEKGARVWQSHVDCQHVAAVATAPLLLLLL